MTDLLERIALCKAKWDMPCLVEALTGEPVPASHKIHSMFNEADNSPSMHIYPDSFYCYSTGKYGDVVDLIRLTKHCTVERAVQILEEEADDLGLVATVRTVAPKPTFVMPSQLWMSPAPGPKWMPLEALPGVDSRVYGELWKQGRIGDKHGALAILHFNPVSGDVVGIKYRHGDGKKTSEPGSDFSSYLYQPFDYRLSYTFDHADPWRPNFCVITEGETDSWAWLSVRPDDHVYALPAGGATWKDAYLKQLEPYDMVYIAMDQDEAGYRARDKITSAVGWGRAEHVQLPAGVKDVREAVAAGWKPILKANWIPTLNQSPTRYGDSQ